MGPATFPGNARPFARASLNMWPALLAASLYCSAWAQQPAWTDVTPGTTPRWGHAIAFDAGRGETILFGGAGSPAIVGDTWKWNGTKWTECRPTMHPSPRFWHAMAYDAN